MFQYIFFFFFYTNQAEGWIWHVCHSFLTPDLSCYETLGSIYILLRLLGGKYNVKMLSLLEKPLNCMAFLCFYQTHVLFWTTILTEKQCWANFSGACVFTNNIALDSNNNSLSCLTKIISIYRGGNFHNRNYNTAS